MASYEQPRPNEWVQPVAKGYRMACCDCGLVHDLDFRIHDGRVQFRARRNRRSTAMMRRLRKRDDADKAKRIAELEAAFDGLRIYADGILTELARLKGAASE